MKSIVPSVERYVDPGQSQKKAGVVPTLGNDEVELKLDFIGPEDHDEPLSELMQVALSYGIHRSQIRNELHVVFFSRGDSSHSELIYHEGSKAAHIKHKSLGQVVLLPDSVPLLRRTESHVKPKGVDFSTLAFHEQVAALIARNNVVGSFKKRTADFQFFVETLGFTLSVSDIDRIGSQERFGQAEIEYLGHRSDAIPPKIEGIYEAFHAMVKRFSPQLRQHISTRAKLEWLLHDSGSGNFPLYPIVPQDGDA